MGLELIASVFKKTVFYTYFYVTRTFRMKTKCMYFKFCDKMIHEKNYVSIMKDIIYT